MCQRQNMENQLQTQKGNASYASDKGNEPWASEKNKQENRGQMVL